MLLTCPHDGKRLEPCAPVPELPADVGARIGDYTVTGVLGKGGMATVYSGVHPLIGKRVAIKVLARELCSRREAVLRFMQEGRSINQIGHPNIVDVYTFGTLPDGRCYQVMEWLQGETLAQRIEDGTLSFVDKVQVGTQVCDALEAAHARGFVHRDLKPENIVLLAVEDRLQVKLLDFGIAKLSAGDPSPSTLTRPECTIGTPQYVSPEQARGKTVEARSDVYSLGVVLYEIFVGQLPYSADNTVDLMVAHVCGEPVPPSHVWPTVPAALEKLLLRMLAKSPAERPQVAEVRSELQYILQAMSFVDVVREKPAEPGLAPPPVAAPPAAVDSPPAVAPPPARLSLSARLAVAAAAAMLLIGGSRSAADRSAREVAAPVAAVEIASTAPPARAAPEPAAAPQAAPALVPVVVPAPSVPNPAAHSTAPPLATTRPAAKPRVPARASRPLRPEVDDEFLVDPFAS